jgi:hypothetical protein
MANLLTSSERSQIATAMHDLLETVSRNIKVIKRGARVAMSEDPNFNFAFPESAGFESEVITEHTISAKIRYNKDQIVLKNTPDSPDRSGQKSSELRLLIDQGGAYINVRSDAYEVLKGVELFVIDGLHFVLDGAPRPRFNFGADIYQIKLKRVSQDGQS